MAAQVGSLYVSLTLNAQPYSAGWDRAAATTSRGVAVIQRQAGLAQRSVNAFTASAGNRSFRPYALLAASRGFEGAADRATLLRASLLSVTAIAGGFTAALSTNVIARYADTFTNLNNQLRTVTSSTSELNAVQDALAGVAGRSRSALQATATLYARTARATETLGLSQENLLKITETVQKAFAIGGATTQEAQGAAIQLSQGIASDRFSGDEFRSVAENAPVLLRGMAEALGVNIGKLREMAHAGELTADTVTKAILKSASRIESEFGQTVISIDRSLTQVDNELLLFIGNADKAFGASRLISAGILGIGENLDKIIPTLATVAGLVGTVFLARSRGVAGGGIGALLGGAAGLGLGGVEGAIIGAGIGGFLGNRGAKTQTFDEVGPDGSVQQRQLGFFEAIKRRSDIAKESVADLTRQQKELRKAVSDSAIARADARLAGRGDLVAQAPASDQSAYKRELQTLQKLDEKRLALNGKIADSYQKITTITSTMSAKAAKLADSQVRSETKLSEALAKQNTLRASRQAALTRETAALGMHASSTAKLAAATDATKQRIAVERQLGQVQREVARETATIANRNVQLAGLVSEADRKAAGERIAVSRQIHAQIREGNKLDEQRAAQTGVAARVRAAAEKSGAEQVKASVDQTRAAYQANSAALARTTAQLGVAARAATVFGQAQAFVGRQVGSIVGLFGGPWGVALTGAILLLGKFGADLAKQAANISNLQQRIQSVLGEELKLRSPDEAGSLLSKKIQETEADIDATIKEAKDAEVALGRLFNLELEEGAGRGLQSIANHLKALENLPIQGSLNKLRDLTEQYSKGEIGVEKYTEELQALKAVVNNTSFDQMANEAFALANTIINVTPLVEELTKQIGEMKRVAGDDVSKALAGTFESLEIEGKGDPKDPKFKAQTEAFASLKKFNDEMEKQLGLLALGAEARSVAAEKQRYLNAAEKDGQDITKAAVIAAAESYAKRSIAIQDATKRTQEFNAALDKLRQREQELAFENAISGLSTFYQEMARTAYQAGVVGPLMKDFVASLNSASPFKLSGVVDQLQRIIEKLLGIKRAEAQLADPFRANRRTVGDFYGGRKSSDIRSSTTTNGIRTTRESGGLGKDDITSGVKSGVSGVEEGIRFINAGFGIFVRDNGSGHVGTRDAVSDLESPINNVQSSVLSSGSQIVSAISGLSSSLRVSGGSSSRGSSSSSVFRDADGNPSVTDIAGDSLVGRKFDLGKSKTTLYGGVFGGRFGDPNTGVGELAGSGQSAIGEPGTTTTTSQDIIGDSGIVADSESTPNQTTSIDVGGITITVQGTDPVETAREVETRLADYFNKISAGRVI